MKHILITLSLVLFSVGCGRPYNSSYSDALIYGSTVTGSSNFSAAHTVMLNRCAKCHTWASLSEADLIAQSKVVARSLETSQIYLRLTGNDAGGPGGMPSDGALSSEEINIFKTWILGM